MRWIKRIIQIIILAAVVLSLICLGIPMGIVIAYWNDLPSLAPLEYETQEWHYPTKVYSDIARISRETSMKGLLKRLERLDYQQVNEDSLTEGQYYLKNPANSADNEMKVYLRELNYPRMMRRPQPVDVAIISGKVAEIRIDDETILDEFILEPEVIAEFYGSEGTDRELVTLDEIPQDLINAFVAIEDKRFYTHSGFDPYRIFGSFYRNFRNRGRPPQGASTITQQLARDLFLTKRQRWSRKIKEALLSIRIERKYTKGEILERYLNRVNLGRRGSREIYGVREAARYFFGKELQELNIQECATLAAIPKDQMGYSPVRRPERSRSRRQIVLSQMLKYEFINQTQYDEAAASKMETATVTEQNSHKRMGYFVEYIRSQAERTQDPSEIHWQGLEIYTTMDISMQLAANRAVQGKLQEVESLMLSQYQPYEENKAKWATGKRDDGVRNPTEYIQAALVAIEPSTGYLKAMVGGRDWYVTPFNRAYQAKRQPGSAFKPFVFCAAFANGLATPATTVIDEFWELEDPSQPGGFWRPDNFRNIFYGKVTIRRMLTKSINVATARFLYEMVGPEKAATLGRIMGIKSPLAPYPSLALGASDVSLLELTSAYGVFANQGMRVEPVCIKYILDRDRNILEENKPFPRRVLDKSYAYLTTHLMEGVIKEGTGRNAWRYGFTRPGAGKTGTTNDETDAWFMGFVPDLAAGVWVGFDDFSKSTRSTGAIAALPIWSDFMNNAVDGPVKEFEVPDDIVFVKIDADTGLPATRGTKNPIDEVFIEGTEPKF